MTYTIANTTTFSQIHKRKRMDFPLPLKKLAYRYPADMILDNITVLLFHHSYPEGSLPASKIGKG